MYTPSCLLGGLGCQCEDDHDDEDDRDDHDDHDHHDDENENKKAPVWVGFAGSANDSLVAGCRIHPVQVWGSNKDNGHLQEQDDDEEEEDGEDDDESTCSNQENFAGKQVSVSSLAVAVEKPATIISQPGQWTGSVGHFQRKCSALEEN